MELFKSKLKIKKWLDDMGIVNYVILENGHVDVNGFVDLKNKNLSFIPVQFNHVSGSFYCSGNRLTSLKGCPVIVDKAFSCSRNKLDDLEFSPKKTASFFCIKSNLKSLKGSPEIIYGSFTVEDNLLTSLEHSPKTIYGSFNCRRNSLTDLQHAPQIVKNEFNCGINPLITLKNFKTIFKHFSFCNEKKFFLEEFRDYYDTSGFLQLDYEKLHSVLLSQKLDNELFEKKAKNLHVKI